MTFWGAGAAVAAAFATGLGAEVQEPIFVFAPLAAPPAPGSPFLASPPPAPAPWPGAAADAAVPFPLFEVGMPPPPPAPLPGSEEVPFDEPIECGVEFSGGICLGSQGKQQVLLAPALPRGLVAHWSFDDKEPLDLSGNRFHGTGGFTPGPAFAGQGHSALFHRTFMPVPRVENILLQDFAYTFWLNLIDTGRAPQGLEHCTILRKGLDNSQKLSEYGQRYAAAPAVLVDPKTRRLRVELQTTTDGFLRAEVVESHARLRRGRWHHIAVVRLDGQKKLRLYVNGILDAALNTAGYTAENRDPWYLGGDPVTQEQCDVPMYLDEVRIYNRSLLTDEIQAEASPSLSGVEPSYVRLGCLSCTIQAAAQKCTQGHHLCSELELHMGGYQVAHANGYARDGARIWNQGDAAAGGLTASAASPSPSSAPGAIPAVALLEQPSPESPGQILPPLVLEPPQPVGLAAQVPEATDSGEGLGLCCADWDR